MKLSIEIDLDNDAVRADSTEELVCVFKRIAEYAKWRTTDERTLSDTRGGIIGNFAIRENGEDL